MREHYNYHQLETPPPTAYFLPQQVEYQASNPPEVQSEITAPATELPALTEARTHRIPETPVGPITVIGGSDHLDTYTADDLARLLEHTHPEDLRKPVRDRRIGFVPDNDVVLRWRHGGMFAGFSTKKLTNRLTDFESEIARLKTYGTPVLRRNVYIVEKDKHNADRPSFYMAVDRVKDVRSLTDPDISLERCTAALDYLLDTPEGDPFIEDSLYGEYQYDHTGTLLDYDPYVTTNPSSRSLPLHDIKGWISRIPHLTNTQQEPLLRRINQILGPT